MSGPRRETGGFTRSCKSIYASFSKPNWGCGARDKVKVCNYQSKVNFVESLDDASPISQKVAGGFVVVDLLLYWCEVMCVVLCKSIIYRTNFLYRSYEFPLMYVQIFLMPYFLFPCSSLRHAINLKLHNFTTFT